jgi:hypothetical protein
MASPFQKYQGEQVQQIPAGYVEAMGSMGRAYASIGQSIAGGIEEADKRAQEEAKTRGSLKAYLKEDPRIQTIEQGLSAGWLAKGEDGTVGVVPGKEQLVDPNKAKPYLDFYNQTGGDGSKLTGAKFTEFISEYDASEKLRKERQAIQLAADKAKTEADLNQAKIDELRSRVTERQANAGMYASLFNTLGGTEQQPLGYNYNAPPVSDGTAVPELNRPVAPAATAPAAVPATQPTVPGAYTEGTSPAAVPQAPVAGKPAAPEAPAQPVYKPEDFDKNGYLIKKPAQAAPAAPAPTAAQKAETQAQLQTPAPAPTAPITYDVPAKTVEVNARLAELNKKRVQVVDTFKTKRNATQGQVAIANRNMTLIGLTNPGRANMANMALNYNQNLLKGIDEAEARELKRIDDDAQAVKTEFTNYQAAATAQRLGTKAKEDTKAAERAAQKTEEKEEIDVVEGYPVVGNFAHVGYNLRDPKTGKLLNPALVAGIPKLDAQSIAAVREANTGYVAAQGYLMKLDDVLRDRNKAGSDWADRFRLTAKNMESYFEGELGSVFGVASLRRLIVSGGNFSDADREFVKSAITYLNTSAPDMSAEDLKASLNALAGFVNSMYLRSLESQGMRFAPDVAKGQAAKLREFGSEASANFVENSVKETERFYNRFGFNPTTSTTSPEFRDAVYSARTTLWNTLQKGGVDTSKFKGSSPEAMKGK